MKKLLAALTFLLMPLAAWAAPSQVLVVDTFAHMTGLGAVQLATNPDINLLGYSSPGDGGAGQWHYNSASSATTNACNVATPSAGSGRLLRQPFGTIIPLVACGAKSDGSTNDTTALSNAYTAAFSSGQKNVTIYVPAGTTCINGAASFNWTSGATVNLMGAGETATVISRCTSGASTILSLSANTGVLDVYATISDLSISGNAQGQHCLDLTTIANLTLRKVLISGCSTGIAAAGYLNASLYDVSLNSNVNGLVTSASSGIHANLLRLYSPNIKSNTTYGLNFIDGTDTQIYGGDIESNGTSSNASTGAVHIGTGVDTPVGYALYSFIGTHFESNLGHTFVADNATGLTLNFTNGTNFLSDEGGHALYVGTIAALNLSDFNIPTPGGTATIAATADTITNANIATLSDTSGSRQYLNVLTSSGLVSNGGSSWVSCTLSSGACTISYPLRAADKVICYSNGDGGTPGWTRVTAESPATSFTVTSSSGSDSSTIVCQVGHS